MFLFEIWSPLTPTTGPTHGGPSYPVMAVAPANAADLVNGEAIFEAGMAYQCPRCMILKYQWWVDGGFGPQDGIIYVV